MHEPRLSTWRATMAAALRPVYAPVLQAYREVLVVPCAPALEEKALQFRHVVDAKEHLSTKPP